MVSRKAVGREKLEGACRSPHVWGLCFERSAAALYCYIGIISNSIGTQSAYQII